MKNILFLTLTLVLLSVVSSSAFARTPIPKEGGLAATKEHIETDKKAEYDYSWLKKVEHDHVCMVTNRKFDKPQIPVEVDGKTYFGCCPMCKGKLETSEELRFAIDPISGNKVNKASAVIGAAPDGEVFYFENEENMKKFDKKKDAHKKHEEHDMKH